jgi:guanyl-specific ribonuclease Sa
MPIRDRIMWSGNNPFTDSRLSDLASLVKDFRRGNNRGWRTDTFENRENHLPTRAYGYYREHYLGPRNVSGSLRIVLGRGGEVYVSGNHYDDFRQVMGIPGV